MLAADDPKVFTDPQSLSFQRLDVSTGTQRKSLLLSLTDAGGGAGTWTVTVKPQAQTHGRTDRRASHRHARPRRLGVRPGHRYRGGQCRHRRRTTASSSSSGNGVQRRIPYAFLVERPALRDAPSTPLKEIQTGDTAKGTSQVSVYCCPAEPFGPPPNYTGAPMNEDGSETLYSFEVDQPIVNFGVSVLDASTGSLIDPFVLGSKDENDVQGYAGIPTDVNSLTFDSGFDVGTAGVQFPRLQRFYVAVDSRADEFTNRSQKGQYVLKAWVDDLSAPAVRILTTRVTAGRPLIAAVAVDLQSGVDPLSLVINYNNALVGASAYDPRAVSSSSASRRRTADQGREDEPDPPGVGLPGDQEHQHRRRRDLPQLDVRAEEADRRRRPHRLLARSACRVCAAKTEQLAVIGGALKKIQPGRIHARRKAHRCRQDRAGRHLLLRLEDREAGEGQPPARRDAHRRGRQDRRLGAQDQVCK